MADPASITRRAALSSVAAVASTSFTASTLLPAPTERGRELLRQIAAMRQAWASRPDPNADPEAFAAFEARYWPTLWRTAAQLAGEIAEQPLRTMDDILDRTIVLAWGNGDVPMDDILAPILDLGGVTFADCECLEVA